MPPVNGVSVVIPTFDRPDQTLAAVSSVLAQTFITYEILLIDDGSSDDYSFLKSLLESYGHEYIKISHKGVSGARNEGIRRAKYDWISFLDSDDTWYPDKLMKQVQYCEIHPEAYMVQCLERWFRNGSEVAVPQHLRPASGSAFERALSLCCISPSAVLLHRNVFERVGFFDERMLVCEDYDYWIRALSVYEIHLIDEPLVQKYSGTHQQLSQSEEAIDRFRVYALAKYLFETDYPENKKCMVHQMLETKLGILLQGAKKRNRTDDIRMYSDLFENLHSSHLCSYMKDGLTEEAFFFYSDLLVSHRPRMPAGGS
jgi:glycosyltransferase involved in cell wall biosynthesis